MIPEVKTELESDDSEIQCFNSEKDTKQVDYSFYHLVKVETQVTNSNQRN